MIYAEKEIPITFRPRFTRQWVDGRIIARKGLKFLVRYKVRDSFFQTTYHTTQWVRMRRIMVTSQFLDYIENKSKH